ncbi:MAG: ABC transporter permease, partial [Myxococcaceae bacterium]
GTLAATASAVATVSLVFAADGFTYMDAQFITWGDLACGFSKTVLCGIYIPAAAAVRGLSARGGAAAVGRAVTLGVVDACLGVLLIDFVIALAFLLAGV